MSKIEWTQETWNPIIGCSKISDGCKNCYAEKMAGRLANIEATKQYLKVLKWDNGYGGNEFETPAQYISEGWNGQPHFVESALKKPLKRKKPTMYFVCSMGDLFHESAPFEWIDKVIEIIAKCPQHTFQILTKRAERMLDYFNHLNESLKDFEGYRPLDNLWLGTTAENQEQADKRIPTLLQIPAAIRFVSIEPMLSKVDLKCIEKKNSEGKHVCFYQVLKPIENCGDSNRHALDWVICGGESGANARPMHPEWVRLLRDQCEEAKVPFFFKQWGEWLPTQLGGWGNTSGKNNFNWCERGENWQWMCKVGKKKAGSILDGKEYKQMPKVKES